MKGIYKGVKCTLSQIFVVKEEEPELQIGGPTDVKHVGHIGWDGPSGGAPSWMNEYKTGPDFSSTSIGNSGSGLSNWSPSQADYRESKRSGQSGSATSKDMPSSELAPIKRKSRRKKCKTSSCPTSTSGSSTRPTRVAKTKAKFVEENAEPSNIQVA